MAIQKIIQTLKTNNTFLISTHVNPDPDAMASGLALLQYLKSIGKTVFVVYEDRVPKRLRFLPDSRLIRSIQPKQELKYDVAIVVDCGDQQRIGEVQRLLKPGKPLINIDHHVTNRGFGTLNLVIPDASSTAEIVYEILMSAGFKLDKKTALLLYLGIMTDTGSFRYENTSHRTHRIVSELMQFDISVNQLYDQVYGNMKASDFKYFTRIISGNNFDMLLQGRLAVVELRKSILNKFSNSFDLRDKVFTILRSVHGIEVIVILTESANNETRVNFRSVGTFNVARLASHFNGGGHKRASGCTVAAKMSDARKQVLKEIKRSLR